MIEMRKLRMQVFYTMVVLTVACIAAGLFWRPWILWGISTEPGLMKSGKSIRLPERK